MLRAATSCARAAISGVGNVPSHILDFFRGSRISDTHLPQFLIRTPRNPLTESVRTLLLLLLLLLTSLTFSTSAATVVVVDEGEEDDVLLLEFLLSVSEVCRSTLILSMNLLID